MAAGQDEGLTSASIDGARYLFTEEKRGDRQTREALCCTFNADLAFFERTVLGVTQSTGARITVVGDARISAPDPRAARNAGIRYVHGVVATPAGSAFYPKVTVLFGLDRALVAVGSGICPPAAGTSTLRCGPWRPQIGIDVLRSSRR